MFSLAYASVSSSDAVHIDNLHPSNFASMIPQPTTVSEGSLLPTSGSSILRGHTLPSGLKHRRIGQRRHLPSSDISDTSRSNKRLTYLDSPSIRHAHESCSSEYCAQQAPSGLIFASVLMSSVFQGMTDTSSLILGLCPPCAAWTHSLSNSRIGWVA